MDPLRGQSLHGLQKVIDIASIKVGDVIIRIVHPDDPNDYLFYSGLILKIVARNKDRGEATLDVLGDGDGSARRWLIYDDSPYRILTR